MKKRVKKTAKAKIPGISEKRKYSERVLRSKADNGFQINIENYLPAMRNDSKPELREAIRVNMRKLVKGQSFFIPDTELSSSTIRLIISEETKKKEYKDFDIRVVKSKPNELKGCRVSRFN
jgi:hypothetical protein